MTGVDSAQPTDDELYRRAMIPYVAKKAVLLQSATVHAEGESIVTTGQFAIGESCYIDDTGHFNAAEFIISYNQMLYVGLAHGVRDTISPAFAEWTMDDYWQRQLPNVLISSCTSRYQRPINPKSYRGVMRINDITFRNRSRPVLVFSSTVEFTDDTGGFAAGEVNVALTEPVQYAALEARR